MSSTSWSDTRRAFSVLRAPKYCPATTAPPVARAVNRLMSRTLMESTRDTADTAASPTLATITESAMPTNMERNCSATRGSIINSTSRGLKISCSACFFKVVPVLSPICCKGNFFFIVPPSRPGVNGQRESPCHVPLALCGPLLPKFPRKKNGKITPSGRGLERGRRLPHSPAPRPRSMGTDNPPWGHKRKAPAGQGLGPGLIPRGIPGSRSRSPGCSA